MRILFSALCGLLASTAHAGETPIYAPAPAWVKERPLEDFSAVKEDALLLIDQQERLSGRGDEYFSYSAYLAHSQDALGEAGNITINWDPATDEVIVHKVAIRRQGTSIDLLGKGQKFTILRRETDLEQAMLYGTLTASLIAEGLESGDVIEVAHTIRRKDPVLAGRSASVIANASFPAKRSFYRQSWPRSEPFKWRVSRDLPTPRIRTAGDMTELSIEQVDPKPREVPRDAPVRFHETGLIEASSFESWQDVSRLLAPYYLGASTLAEGSALKSEAARIKAEHGTAAARARAALAAVQERMRYVYMDLGTGGYVPAQAEQSWSRKFGDCKAKTAVLLALLSELGIPARAALVSSARGDGLDKRLPSLLAFDHVIVRAEVDGRVYWLDGTARDAGGLDRVETADFRWALPLSADGAKLEQLPAMLPAFPTMRMEVELDARQGTTLPVQMKLAMHLAGRGAAEAHASFDLLSPAKRKETLLGMFGAQGEKMKVKDATTSFDAATGIYSITVSGTADLPWQQGENSRRYIIEGGRTPPLPRSDRKEGPDRDLPVVVPPVWLTARTTVLLPDAGKGFRVAGADVNKKAGGIALKRVTKLEGDRLVVDFETRTLQREISAAEAETARGILTDLTRSRLALVAESYSVGAAERAAIAAEQPKDVNALLDRGNNFIDRGEYALAVQDMEAVLKIDPNHAVAIANRGIAKFWLKDLAGAQADFEAAARRDASNAVSMRGLGLLALERADYPAAVASFSAALEQDESDRFSLYRRARAFDQIGQVDKSLADLDALLKLGEDPIQLHAWRASILMHHDRTDEALAALAKLVEAHPTDPAVRLLRASALGTAKRNKEAVKEYGALIELKPSVAAYLGRAKLREESDPALALADAEAALGLDPDDVGALSYAAERLIAGSNAQAALARLDAAIERKPEDASLRLARATARVKAGRAVAAVEDVKAAQGVAKNSGELNEVCWWGATKDQALEIALRACDDALSKSPKSPAVHDSRALVLYRLGRYHDALAAYDQALKLAPDQAASLYGRSLVKARLNDQAGSLADREKALRSSKDVDEEFQSYGIGAPTSASAGMRAAGRP
jgi:tetratricopeptide (TPR) repeat protein